MQCDGLFIMDPDKYMRVNETRFFIYWGRPLKISTALYLKKKQSNYEYKWDIVL